MAQSSSKSVSSHHCNVVIAANDMVLSSNTAGGKIFATYLEDAKSLVEQYSLDGKLERKIALPAIGTASGFSGKAEDKEIYFSFTSYTVPTTIYKYDIMSGEVTLHKQPEVKFEPDDYETKQRSEERRVGKE